MNRRHFIKCGMAAGVAIALGRKVARAVGYHDSPSTREYARQFTVKEWNHWRDELVAQGITSIDVTGAPTPDWLHKGKPMETYFHAGRPEIPRDIRCFLNGVEVTKRASECDTRGGWVRMFDVDDKGKFSIRHVRSNDPAHQKFTGLHDENWKPVEAGYTLASVERIHFGKVVIQYFSA